MKLILLEQNKDKKGSLLESIVKILLSSFGYEYVATNEIGAGGNEIDIVAEKRLRSIGEITTYPLICECKAHEAPINMNDWLKFLGKIYKEKRKNSLSTGLMIALSDANGNVKGDIRNESYREDVRLITGNDLVEPVISYYKMSSVSELLHAIKRWTNLTIIEYDIAFYSNTPYWILYFSNGTFTVLDKDCHYLQDCILHSLLSSFVETSTYTKEQYIDIRKDKVIAFKKKAIKNIAVWALMKEPLSFKRIKELIILHSGNQLHVDESEVEDCLNELDFIQTECDNACLKQVSEINMIDFYKTVLDLGIPTNLYNSFYIEHIDDLLLDKVLGLQGNIVLNKEERDIVLFVLKHSPSALKTVLQPNPLFMPKTKVKNGDLKALNDSVKSTLIQTLSSRLEYDADSDIAMLLFDKLELRDFFKRTDYYVVLKDGTEYKIPISKRLYYIPFDDIDGGAVVQASNNFIGKYDPTSGYMIAGKKTNKQEETLFGIVKHKTGESEEYLSIFG